MKKILKISLPILILVSGIGVFAALKTTKPVQPQAQTRERVWRVEVEPVQPRTLAPVVTLYGRLETPSLFRAAAPAPSRVARVTVREGDRVEAGQPLVELDERDFLPRLAQARADLAELEAQLESERIRHEGNLDALKQERKLVDLAQAAVGRARRMLKQGVGSDSALDDAEQVLARQALLVTSREQAVADHPARKQALEAKLQRARAQVAEAELDFERSKIQAPYAGIVAKVEVAEGDQVKDNAVLLSLYDPAGLELRARIPAPYQAELLQALADGSVLAGEADGATGPVRLRLARLAGEADASGVDGLFRIDSGSERLRVGQVLRFRLRRPAREQAVAVPFQSVYGGGRIYRLVEGKMQGVDVEPLGSYRDAQGDERLLIHSPELADGDRLVITHLPNAIDGLRAEVVEPQM